MESIVEINLSKYRILMIVVTIFNSIVITSAYYSGVLGNNDGNFIYLVLAFIIETFLNPLDYVYTQQTFTNIFLKDTKNKKVRIVLRKLRVISITAIFLLSIAIIALYFYDGQVGILGAFILLFYFPIIFNYMFLEMKVLKCKKG